MRQFPYITVGKILDELAQDGLKLSRVTFLRLEKRLNLPQAKRTSGKLQWRVYTREQAETIKDRIRDEFNFITT
jgi:hypothetical protein